MEFMKKQSAGFYFSILTVILTVVGTVLYFGNCKTAYFASLGVNTIVAVCLVLAVIFELVFMVGNEIMGSKMVFDIFPVATAICLIIAIAIFISTRVNGIAAIMTFSNNESTMADLNNTIVAIIFCVIAFLLSVITSFFRVVKEK